MSLNKINIGGNMRSDNNLITDELINNINQKWGK